MVLRQQKSRIPSATCHGGGSKISDWIGYDHSARPEFELGYAFNFEHYNYPISGDINTWSYNTPVNEGTYWESYGNVSVGVLGNVSLVYTQYFPYKVLQVGPVTQNKGLAEIKFMEPVSAKDDTWWCGLVCKLSGVLANTHSILENSAASSVTDTKSLGIRLYLENFQCFLNGKIYYMESNTDVNITAASIIIIGINKKGTFFLIFDDTGQQLLFQKQIPTELPNLITSGMVPQYKIGLLTSTNGFLSCFAMGSESLINDDFTDTSKAFEAANKLYKFSRLEN